MSHDEEQEVYYQATLCRPWRGRPSEYQSAAKDVIEDRLDRSLPWHYVVAVCETKYCMTDPHLIAHRAQKLAYPASVCIYCGMPGYTKDHLLPTTVTGESVRKFVAVVPACLECNSSLGDRCGYRISERREEAHRHIRKKHRKTLELTKRWSKQDLAELGPNLRTHISNGLAKREILMQRLEWPWDPYYDVRAFEKSGYEHPLELGLL